MRKLFLITIAALIVSSTGFAQAQKSTGAGTQGQVNSLTESIPVIPGVLEFKGAARGETRISKEVRHELLMLPYYSLFDDLRYRVEGSTVELLGDVNTPSLKGDAEAVVKKIEGVEKVVNNINILPPSSLDDRIRQRTARAIFSFSGLSRYGWEAAPSIHIVVKNGHVTLLGVVDSEGDKNAAGLRANGVPGVFSVDNKLYVAKR